MVADEIVQLYPRGGCQRSSRLQEDRQDLRRCADLEIDMTTVFIAGSMNIRRLDPRVQERIDNIVKSGLDIVVGDADGADTSIQEHLFKRGAAKTTVFCSGATPRNNVGHWPVHPVQTKHRPGSRAFFTAKDLTMTKLEELLRYMSEGAKQKAEERIGLLGKLHDLKHRQGRIFAQCWFKNVSPTPASFPSGSSPPAIFLQCAPRL